MPKTQKNVRSYVIENPMDELAEGIYERICCIHNGSGLKVTVAVDSQGVQTWTYDYRQASF